MGDEITIEVGDSFAVKDTQFSNVLGEQYTSRMRQLVEDELHTLTQELERRTEQQEAQVDPEDLEEPDED